MLKICFLQFNIVIYLLIILFEEKTKTVRHLKFVKSLSLSLLLIPFCVKDGLGFNRLFCQVLGGFWWVPIMVFTEKKYTYIYEEHSHRASNKAFFVCANLIVSFLNAFGLKNRQCCQKR